MISNIYKVAATTDTDRFQDKNLILSDFEDVVFVECPKCEKRAVVTKEEPKSYFSNRVLKCPNCFYSQNGRRESFVIKLNSHCVHCAAEINIDLQDANKKKETIAVRCSKCGQTGNYKPRNIPQEWKYKFIGKPFESYFGLPLWLTGNFRGNNLWANNYEHLAYLKQYIAADLRERNDRTHSTMVEKLPPWMTSGKNRDKIIKLISELERK